MKSKIVGGIILLLVIIVIIAFQFVNVNKPEEITVSRIFRWRKRRSYAR